MTFIRFSLLLIGAGLMSTPNAFSQPLFVDSSQTALPKTAMPENGMDVESIDVDADGDLDIVIANEYQSNVILINDGTGHFTDQSSTRLPRPKHDSEDIATGDFDGDGDPDIVFVSEDDVVHEYYLNNGAGVFSIAPYTLPNSESNAVTAADLNGDGRLDLVIGNAGQDFVLINNGSGGFLDETEARLPADETVTQDVELTDIDNDGDLDLIQGNEDGNRLFVNSGNGVFVDETETRLPILANMETRKVTPGDVNNDGFVDLFFANVAFRAGKVLRDRLYINDGTGHFTDLTDALLPFSEEHTIDGKFADIDYDDDLDLIVSSFMNRPVFVFLNDGEGTFTDHTSDVFPAPVTGDGLGIEVADLNGDSLLDLYICNRGQKDRLLFHARAAGTNAVNGSEEQSALENLSVTPNPASAAVVIEYLLRRNALVELQVSNTLGERVESIHSGKAFPGKHRVVWDSSIAASGTYLLTLTIDGNTSTRQIVVR